MKYLFAITFFICSNLLSSQELPVFNEEIKPGVYASFEEFKNNEPSISDSLVFEMIPRHQKNWKGTFSVVPYYYRDGARRKNVKNAWGFSDGKDAYISFSDEFFKIIISENSLSFYGYDLPDDMVGTHPLLLPVGGGVAMGLVFVFDPKAKRTKKHYGLGLWKGIVALLPDFGMKLIHEAPDIKLVFFRNGNEKRWAVTDLLINDSIEVHFDTESYRTVNVEVSDEPIKVSLADGSDHVNIEFKNQKTEYISLASNTMKGDVVLRLLSPEEGRRISKKARERQRKVNSKTN